MGYTDLNEHQWCECHDGWNNGNDRNETCIIKAGGGRWCGWVCWLIPRARLPSFFREDEEGSRLLACLLTKASDNGFHFSLSRPNALFLRLRDFVWIVV